MPPANSKRAESNRAESITVHDRAAIEAWRSENRLDPHWLKRMRLAFYKRSQGADRALDELPMECRDRARNAVDFYSLELIERHDSKLDGASKLLFRTRDGLVLETVILRVQSGRTALCVSSQVGCGAGCRFCATGMGGVRRSLTAAEIVDQLVQANELLQPEERRVRNIVFMGMGEPFHAEAAVHEALDLLGDPACFDHTLRQVAVSTVGIPDAMVRCARAFPRVRLALSLHSARQAVRERIIPLAGRYSLAALHAAVEQANALQEQPVMLEYLLLDGVSDTAEDLDALTEFATGLDVHLNLIPFNPIPGAPELAATPRARREEFGAALKARGFTVTLRYSLGADVTAACGQLARAENQR